MLRLSVTGIPDAWDIGGRLDTSFIGLTPVVGVGRAFGHGLLLYCARSRQTHPPAAALPLLSQRRLLTELRVENRARMKCIHPVGEDLGLIAVTAPVLLRSPEAWIHCLLRIRY